MSDKRNSGRSCDDDDGHVIAPMNVEGMPWYSKKSAEGQKPTSKAPRYSKKETRMIIFGTLKAALLIAGVFLAVFFLFILILCLAV